jgi:hypothetical protein
MGGELGWVNKGIIEKVCWLVLGTNFGKLLTSCANSDTLFHFYFYLKVL